MGLFDLPAVFDYIQSLNPQKLYYIGHSMGTTMFFVLASTRPDYVSERVQAMIALSPVAFAANIKTPAAVLTEFFPKIRVSKKYLCCFSVKKKSFSPKL